MPVPASPPRAWAEIKRSALRHNLKAARHISGCQLMAVVKAGAYGHGLEQIARLLSQEDIAFLGVANVGEARRITQAVIDTRIFLLGATWADERREIVAHHWTPCLSSLDEAKHFSQLARAANTRLKVHLAVDTGMGRGGFVVEELTAIFPQLEALPGLELEGIGSHLPAADEDPAFTGKQFVRFTQIVNQLGGHERFRWIHLSNSAGLMAYDDSHCNLARPGLMLYGISPVPEHQPKLENVMTLKSRVTLIRSIPPGHGISYGRSFVTKQQTRLATIGIGYGDGYPRHLSGKGAEVVIRNRRHPLLGRVTMDQIMVDVGDSDVQVGDQVELFGPNLRVDELAAKADTIAWEILTGITPRVVRIYD